MNRLKIIPCLFVVFYSCKKTNEPNSPANPTNPPPTSNSVMLVKTITSKMLKDTSGNHFTTEVDSFQYDNLNRVSKYIVITYDTSLRLLVSGDTLATPYSVMSTITFSYTGDNLIPSGWVNGSQHSIYTTNSAGQLAIDSVSRDNVRHYTYFPGLIVALEGDTSVSYTIDSIIIDQSGNVSSEILGGNYFQDSLNRQKFGRIAQWNYTYGTIENPLFANKSGFPALFFFTKLYRSKYIIESINYTAFSDTVIIKNEVLHFQNIVDSKNVIQKSINESTGESASWTYY